MPGPITDSLLILRNLTLRSLRGKTKAQRLQAAGHTASWRQSRHPGGLTLSLPNPSTFPVRYTASVVAGVHASEHILGKNIYLIFPFLGIRCFSGLSSDAWFYIPRWVLRTELHEGWPLAPRSGATSPTPSRVCRQQGHRGVRCGVSTAHRYTAKRAGGG